MFRGTISALVQDARFEVVRELGRGEHAAVYLVWDHHAAAFRAIKILATTHRDRTHALRRFIRESRTLTQIDHPHILTLHRTGLIDGRPYLVSEYADGGSAADWIHRHGPVPPRAAAEMVAQAAEAVHEAHRAGILHRNLKPSNLLLSSRGTLVGDFGIARRHTRTGAPVGFLAPEQIESPDVGGPAADVYGLGATLYALVTGEMPRDLHRCRPGTADLLLVPAPFRSIVTRACDARPERRHTSAAALAMYLQDATRDLTPAPLPPGTTTVAADRVPTEEDEPSLVQEVPTPPPLGRTVTPSSVAPRSAMQTLRELWDGWVGR